MFNSSPISSINYIIQASTSTDSGATWSIPVNLSAAGQDAEQPQVTSSADAKANAATTKLITETFASLDARQATDPGVRARALQAGMRAVRAERR